MGWLPDPAILMTRKLNIVKFISSFSLFIFVYINYKKKLHRNRIQKHNTISIHILVDINLFREILHIEKVDRTAIAYMLPYGM